MLTQIKKLYLLLLSLNFLYLYSQPSHNSVIRKKDYLSPEFVSSVINDKLAGVEIRSILQGPKGLMWLGTRQGVFTYDGYQLNKYQHNLDDSTSIPNNNVSSIILDNENDIWITTSYGISKYNFEKDHFINYYIGNPLLNKHEISAGRITIDNEGAFWVSSLTNGVFLFNEKNGFYKNFRKYNSPGGLLSDVVFQVLIDSNNQKWVVQYGSGISKYDPERKGFKHYYFPDSFALKISKHRITEAIITENNQIWITTEGAGILIFDIDKQEFKTTENDLFLAKLDNVEIFYDIEEVAKGILWLGSGEKGLYICDQNNAALTNFKYDYFDIHGLFSNNINTIYKDKAGGVWVASVYKGLQKYYPNLIKYKKHFYHPLNKNGIYFPSVISLFYDSRGWLWIGTDGGGLSLLKNPADNYIHFRHDKESPEKTLAHNNVTDIIEDSKGNIWLATWGGVSKITPSLRIQSFYADKAANNTLPGDNIWCIFEDNKGRIWISIAYFGIVWFSPENGVINQFSFDPENSKSISSNFVYEIFQDRQDRIWFGTSGGGISRFNEEDSSFHQYKIDPHGENTVKALNIYDITSDKNNHIVFATSNGLHVYNEINNNFINYTTENGMPENTILNVKTDSLGNIWLTSTHQIAHVKLPDKLNDYPDSIDISLYSQENSNLNLYFNFNTSSSSAAGELAFGGNRGYLTFKPKNMQKIESVPQIIFTDLLIKGKPVTIGEESNGEVVLKKSIKETNSIRLSYKNNSITIKFAALHYASPQNNKCRYKLKGLDDKWHIKNATDNSVTYSNLPAGIYKFQLNAANTDGVWAPNPIELNIQIVPPWYETLAFRTSMLILILALLFLYTRLRTRFYRKNQALLQLKVLERTKELNARNEQVGKMARELEESTRLKISFFMNISHEFRTPLTLILGPLDALLKQETRPVVKNQLGLVHRNARRLLRLINQLLDLRKLESGAMKLHASRDNIVEVVHKIFLSFNYLSERHEIDYRFSSSIKEWETWFDQDILEKILYNLLANAFRYTPDGGKITLSLQLLEESKLNQDHDNDKENKKHLEIAVKDTGVGIEKEVQEKIFDRFFMVDKSGFRKKGGTGIGLALTKELVELHHGSIRVQSEPGKGAEFVVNLTLGKAILKEEEIATDAPEIEADKYPHITQDLEESPLTIQSSNDQKNLPLLLLVDDNEDILTYIGQNLNGEFKLVMAVNGQEALERAIENPPDIVVSDVMMPVMDGIKFAGKLKTEKLTAHIPIIFLTAKTEEISQIKGLKAGASDYIVKPFNMDILRLKISNILMNRQKLIENFKNQPNTDVLALSDNEYDTQFLEDVLKIIENNIGNSEFNANMLANALQISRAQLYRKIQSISSQSVNEFIRTIRLKKAAVILSKKKPKMAQLAYSLGFNSPAYFNRSFKEKFGKSPTEYHHQCFKEKG